MADSNTTNFGFRLVSPDSQPWHDKEHDNWRLIDALLARYLVLSGLEGVWQNATVYAVGDRVVDGVLGTIWECVVANTSSSTGTFAAYRTANSSHWTAISFQVTARGTWTTATAYNVNDFVVSGYIFATCITAHTSGATFAGDSAKWAYLINLTSIVAEIQADADAVAAALAAITLPIPVASGGTGATTAILARAALGLVIGTDVQASNSVLSTLAGASANGQSLITAASYAVMKALLDLEIGTDIQAYDANTAKLNVAQTFTKRQAATPVALTSTSNSVAVDMSLGNNFTHTFTENTTLANPTNTSDGTSGQITFTQHASAAKTLAYGSNWIEASTGVAPSVSTTVGTINVLSYYVADSTHIYYTLLKHGVA